MRLTFQNCRIENDDGCWLCLKVNEPAPARKFVLTHKDKLFDCEIKEHRNKRSLDANNYAWVLMDKIAQAIGGTKEDVYLQKVKEVGPFRDWTFTEEEANTFRIMWERQGKAWPTELVDYASDGEHLVIRSYYGSSSYSTKRMSRLIDSIIDDCKVLGIETLPPEKIEALKTGWDSVKEEWNLANGGL